MKTRHLKAPNHVTQNALKLADELVDNEDVTPHTLKLATFYALLGIGEALQELVAAQEAGR